MPAIVNKNLPTPPRANIPITAGYEPQWDLRDVSTNDLVAELIRRRHPKFFQPVATVAPIVKKLQPQPIKASHPGLRRKA